jgi:dihydrolipoamide dehydrogenase
MNRYDLAVIGSGPGGYVAALQAARLNKTVCLIEKGSIGGTCLNRGCIPTKAYAASRDALYKVQNAGSFGIDVSRASVNFKEIFKRKNLIVKAARKSVINLLRGNKVDIIKGAGRLVDKNTVEAVNKKDGAKTTVQADNIIIATGSKPLKIPVLNIDHENVLTSSDVLKLDTLMKDMVIIGGGIIGCEFASIFSAFGVKVTIVELLDSILPTADPKIVSPLKRRFKKMGIRMITGVKVEDVASGTDGVELTLSDKDKLRTDRVLVSVGRASNTSGLGLNELGIKLDGDKIVVGEDKRTNIGNIFAIGDVTAGPMLAHKASYDGICAVHSAFGLKFNSEPFYNIPSVVFTDPEIAYVGISEQDAKDKSIEYRSGHVSYSSSSKAACMGESDGLIKVIAKKETGVIMGASICGAHASDLIYGLGVAISRKMKAEEVCKTIFAHPTLSELVKEALEDVDGLSVHKIYKT